MIPFILKPNRAPRDIKQFISHHQNKFLSASNSLHDITPLSTVVNRVPQTSLKTPLNRAIGSKALIQKAHFHSNKKITEPEQPSIAAHQFIQLSNGLPYPNKLLKITGMDTDLGKIIDSHYVMSDQLWSGLEVSGGKVHLTQPIQPCSQDLVVAGNLSIENSYSVFEALSEKVNQGGHLIISQTHHTNTPLWVQELSKQILSAQLQLQGMSPIDSIHENGVFTICAQKIPFNPMLEMTSLPIKMPYLTGGIAGVNVALSLFNSMAI